MLQGHSFARDRTPLTHLQPEICQALLLQNRLNFEYWRASWCAIPISPGNVKGSPVEPKLPEDVALLFRILDKAEEAGLSQAEIRQKFRLIVEKYAANMVLNKEMRKELDAFKQDLKQSEMSEPSL